MINTTWEEHHNNCACHISLKCFYTEEEINRHLDLVGKTVKG